MYLAEGNTAAISPFEPEPTSGDAWEHFPFSCLSHHKGHCCDVAREWLLAMDFAQLNGADLSSGPRWLRANYKWGPSSWPMHWCEVVKLKAIDCGAHAALSREAFAARGLTAFPTQLVQRYSEDATEQWRCNWVEEEVSCHWLDGERIYHEATALLIADNEVKIWDGSSGSWVDARQPSGGYGSLVAVKVHADPQFVRHEGFKWGDRRLLANVWNQIEA